MVAVEQHVGIDEVKVVAGTVRQIEPLANLGAGIPHKNARHRRNKGGRPRQRDERQRNEERPAIQCGVRRAPGNAKARLAKRRALGAQPIQAVVEQVEARMPQNRAAGSHDGGLDRLRDAARHQRGAIREVIAHAKDRAQDKRRRRKRNRRPKRIALSKQHVAYREHQQQGQRQQHDRVAVPSKGKKYLVADVKRTGGSGVELGDCFIGHGCKVDGERRRREQAQQEGDRALPQGIVPEPQQADGVFAGRSRSGRNRGRRRRGLPRQVAGARGFHGRQGAIVVHIRYTLLRHMAPYRTRSPRGVARRGPRKTQGHRLRAKTLRQNSSKNSTKRARCKKPMVHCNESSQTDLRRHLYCPCSTRKRHIHRLARE